MAGKYNIQQITRDYFPWFWQTVENLALVDLLMSANDDVNEATETAETDFEQQVGYSIQRLSLESSLNVRFDPDQKRIEIKNGDVAGDDFIFNEAESVSSSLFVYGYNEAETDPRATSEYFYLVNETESSGTIEFTVFVPSSLMSSEQQIRAWIERVQMLGTSYEIIYT